MTGSPAYLRIASNTSQMLRFAHVFSRSLAFFIRFFSLFRYSPGRSIYIPPCKKYIFISLG